jgi:DNA repair protein RecN (Recombination protein N)
VRRLREVGRLLVDLHGQHEHQSLLDPDSHARFLDECGGLATEATEVSEAHSGLLVAREALIRLQGEQRQLREEEELRSYQLEEIRRLAPEPGEDERLERDVSLLANQETLARTCLELYESLYGADDSEVRRLGQARRELEQLQRFDPDLGTRVEAFSEIVLRVEDLAAGLRDYADSLEADPTRLEASRERLEELRRLSRRHGGDLESVLATAQRLEGLEDRSRSLDADLATAEATRARADGRFAGACAVLSGGRQQARDRLGSAAEEGLGELGMEAAAFRVELTPRESPDAHGAESVEFHVSANRGEPLLPLARVASGGELSRIMLALKQIIAERDPVSTLVFDEVDTGISGRVAAAVGRRLGQLSQTRQTLVITHLPQIASGADAHFSVRKSEQGDRTVTEVVALEGQDRAQEIAGLLAGEQVSDTALRHAQEMLE